MTSESPGERTATSLALSRVPIRKHRWVRAERADTHRRRWAMRVSRSGSQPTGDMSPAVLLTLMVASRTPGWCYRYPDRRSSVRAPPFPDAGLWSVEAWLRLREQSAAHRAMAVRQP